MISFQTVNIDMPVFDEDLVCRWIGEVAARHSLTVANITYCFCDDEEILRSNREYLGHDYYTDVITFDYSHDGRISGDILISLDTVRSNAETVGEPYEREFYRVIIHGVLHLCGIDDKGPGEREVMEAEENAALGLLEEMKSAE